MLVELDVFSGQPNPRWQLSTAAAEELRQLQGGLAGSSARPVELPGLGYRGFVYQDAAGTCRAYGGVVWSPLGILADSDRSVERFLLAHMPKELEALRPRIAAALGPSR